MIDFLLYINIHMNDYFVIYYFNDLITCSTFLINKLCKQNEHIKCE